MLQRTSPLVPDATGAKAQLLTEVARSSGRVSFRATGFSMLPAIRPGDVLTVQRPALASLQPGDIVLTSRRDAVAAHRVKQMDECVIRVVGGQLQCTGTLVTQGDALAKKDPVVAADQLLGVVVSVERGGKAWLPPRNPGPVCRIVAATLRHSEIALQTWHFFHLLPQRLNRLAAPVRRWVASA